MLKREEIRIRDPFILTDREDGCYYMYGTTALDIGTLAAKNTFSVYKTYDLENFEEPKIIFDGSEIGFWADRDFWAPEVHKFNGRYYLFGSFKADGECRATQILVCDTPDGKFVPVSNKPATPEGWECLDGTFFVEDGTPYIIFSHEWCQVKDGEIWAMPLKDDLTASAGDPVMLFKASDNKNVSELGGVAPGNYVTDGPFLYREEGKVKMIWSSFYNNRYLVLDAEADSLLSEWRHGGSRFDFDGGHAMIFETLDGKRMISLHRPNTANHERAFFTSFDMSDRRKRIREICAEIEKRLYGVHIDCFKGMDKPLFLISEAYPGIWLEHVYDSVFLAKNDPSMLYLAENTVDLFIRNQKSDGQLPCFVLDGKRRKDGDLIGYGQIQECVSFARLGFIVYEMNRDRDFLLRLYEASKRWVGWLKRNRMTTQRGLIEMFVGYDTGHDNSGRLSGLSCIGNYSINGVGLNAAVLPVDDDVAPVIAVDMNCNFYSTLVTLSKMALELEQNDEAAEFEAEAREVKKRLFELCYDGEDDFFYDVDKMGNKRKFLSSTVFHLFLEGLLDRAEDAALIERIYKRHISNPEEFATPYPYPSMAVNDPSCIGHATFNCWGYYSQGLIALRATLWMEKYGFEAEFDNLCEKWVEVWTDNFDKIKMAQEIDPITGEPTRSSEWYSSTMLFYLYSVKRLEKQRK